MHTSLSRARHAKVNAHYSRELVAALAAGLASLAVLGMQVLPAYAQGDDSSSRFTSDTPISEQTNLAGGGFLGDGSAAPLTALGHSGETAGNPASPVPQSESGAAAVQEESGDVLELPQHIVNGDFDYPDFSMTPSSVTGYTQIARRTKQYFDYGSWRWKPIPEGFDTAAFGWDSTQTDPPGGPAAGSEQRANGVELQHDAISGNAYAELAAAQGGTAIYQDIATVPGAVYTWSLRHTSMDSTYLDKMSVLIGPVGAEVAQDATRTSVNGNGDTLGPVGTVISTKAANASHDFKHEGQWETYTGTYTVPEGQTVTRFTFSNIASSSPNYGNDVDDITFDPKYPLSYDVNGGSGSVPASKELFEGDRVAQPTLTRSGYTFMGWSETDQAVAAVGKTEYEAARLTLIDANFTMPDRPVALHAVWVKNPLLCYDTAGFTNDPWGPVDCQAHPYGTVGYNFNDWGLVAGNPDGGSTTIWPGHRFEHWNYLTGEAGTDTGVKFDRNMPLTDNTYVIAIWVPAAGGSLHPNGARGSDMDYVGQDKYEGDTVPAPSNTYARSGYTFVQWNSAADGSGANYLPGEQVLLTNGLNDLYARWSANPAHVTYLANGASGGAVPVQSGVTDDVIELADNGFERPGYEFTGWNTSADGMGVRYQPHQSYTMSGGGMTLYAQWKLASGRHPALPIAGGPGVTLFLLLAGALLAVSVILSARRTR